MPTAVYWGPPLPMDEDLASLAEAARSDITGGMLDRLPPLSLCPAASQSFPGQPGLVAYRDGAPLYPAFQHFADGTSRDGCEAHITVRDDSLGLGLLFHFEVLEDVIVARTVLEADSPITLHHLAAPLTAEDVPTTWRRPRILHLAPIADELGHAPPPAAGWAVAVAGAGAVLAVDALDKARRRQRAP